MRVRGNAFWHGLGDDVHEGEIAASAAPQGDHVVFVEEDCTVRATLAGRYLIVADNENCGGMNVRLDGGYTREKR